jgi:Ca2+-binding EF-hand superfamily protein
VDTIDSFGRRHKGRRLGTGGDVIAAARNELSAFVRAVTTNDGTLPPRQEVVRLFDRGDFQPARGRAHTIDCDAFGRMVDDLGMNLTKEEKTQLFHSYGPQSDGKLRAEAFLVGLTGNKDATPFTETDPNPEPVRFPKQPRQFGPARLPVAADEPVVDSATTDDVLRHIKERIEFKNPLPGRAKADFVREFGFTDNARTGIIGEAALRKALWRGGFGLPEAHIQVF